MQRHHLAAAMLAGGSVLWMGFLGYRWWQSRPLSHVDVYDGFETRELSGIWDTSRFASGAVTMQSKIVRSGRGAAKVVVHSRDIFEAGVSGEKDSERAELMEAPNLVSKENNTYEYSFSMFIPADFPVVPTRLVMAQWKQDCDGHAACSNNSPVVAVRYSSGVLQITQQVSAHRTALFEGGEDLRGRWSDFRFRICFTPRQHGLVQAWLNGRQVVEYSGVNAYPENAATGYRSPSLFYFKMGLYRDVMADPMAIYIDEYRKRQLPAGWLSLK